MKNALARALNLWRFQAKNVYLLGRTAAGRLPWLARAAYRNQFSKEYTVALPDGFGAKRVTVRLSIPDMPAGRLYLFSEHVHAGAGHAGGQITACTTGGFAFSHDLGLSWKAVNLWCFANLPFQHSRRLRAGEILLAAIDPDDPGTPYGSNARLVICDLEGNVRHSARIRNAAWHGPRAIDMSGETLMYADYAPNAPRGKHDTPSYVPSHVWRSRDFGRSWEMVFEQTGVRHFHFLQARPGVPGEWWLTSGDTAEESRIWRSTDDGDSWADQTEKFGATVDIANTRFPREIFRLTDLIWDGDEILWGSDDVLHGAARIDPRGPAPGRGARLLRGNPSTGEALQILGQCDSEVRNVVELADFHLVLTQSIGEIPPAVLLMPKKQAAGRLCKLFDIDLYSAQRTGFTYSRASRSAEDGVFFTFRNPTDAFDVPGRILRWEVKFA